MILLHTSDWHLGATEGEIARLMKKWTHFETEIGEAENDLAFAKKLRGDSGIGLQRYILAIMFNQVIGEANRMLEKVHGGAISPLPFR